MQAACAALFFASADMTLWLKRMRHENKLEATMRELAKCGLFIIDEFVRAARRRGGGPPAVSGSRELLREKVAGDHHQHRVLEVGTVLANDKLASAMIDRIVHRGRFIEFTGPSRRMDAALMLAGARKAV